ncbi:tetratricopeptide repeat protein [Prevotella sp. OH937_COT-195]|uniref:type IX secretion system periplasmic lipoprotein PorW/SprE n=1 Tax=Prevotella sp. OH937_COT-195 TaxID=2491051 RepID=UPI000F654A65|nr:tetratricopeptide repeat protein [Prevotella sp. OH937_COT-195]RRD02314.1 hypothetical protein EII32_03605 [Prevotella sp. OH937_COT-195]
MKSKEPYIAVAIVAIVLLAACSTQKNTSSSRWWHSFNARYNTYYNGAVAYVDASLEREKGNKDNFTERIPLYTIGNKTSRELGKGNYERAIEKAKKAIKQHSIRKKPEWNKSRKKTEKDREWLSRREYNPFLWKAWLLMGRAQFHKGDFDEAASTFAYMSRLYATQPAIAGKARAWLAKCYIEQGFVYDAEDVIAKMRRDTMDWRAVKEWDYTFADYYIHTNRIEQAIPYLQKVIRHEMRRKQKAREWYLMGQLQAELGNRDLAYKAFRHVIRLNPPYELEFNARIAMTEVTARGKAKQMIGKLKRMAASDNNKEYLDQVYYAMGNIYLSERDTVKAIDAYETGNKKTTRAGVEKGVLLLKLGDLYWARENFSDARRCYGEAIGLLDKTRKDYEALSYRSKVLDELVPFTEAVHLQDSLQALAKMSETDRNAAIDRVIEALKKKEKEERLAQAEQEAQQQQAANQGNTGNIRQNSQQQQQTKNGLWYFYNQMAVNQGKAAFQKLWGRRENVDNWQRVNRTVVAQNDPSQLTDEMRDSIAAAEALQDSIDNSLDSAQNDPHKREYYLAQIPFTEEQVQASNLIIEDGLFHAGVIFKDKLDFLKQSEKHLTRLENHYPDYEHTDDAFYHLFLLYHRMGMPGVAESYIEKLKSKFPKSKWTTMLSDPHFEENARFGTMIEDSLYAATYEAFKADRNGEVKRNAKVSKERFPMGANRDKFIFIDGLGKLNDGDTEGCLTDMNNVVKNYPNSRISELAGMIINGVKAGRRLRGGKFDIGDVWERRSIVLNDSDSIQARQFVADRLSPHLFILAYTPDSIAENKLLFEMARYNFSNFMVRNFDIAIDDFDGLHRMQITGFRSYDEALQYARKLYKYEPIVRLIKKARGIIISEANLPLLGTNFSYKDYDKFYDKHFAPLKPSTMQLLNEPAEIEYEKQQEKPQPQEGDENTYDNKESDGTVIETTTETTEIVTETTDSMPETTIEDTPETTVTENDTTTENVPETIVKEENNVVEEPEQPATNVNTEPKEPEKREPEQPEKITTKEPEDEGIYFDDGFGTENNAPGNNNNNNNNNKNFDIEDEYYDLEGF